MRKFDYSFLKDKHLNDILRLSNLIADVNAKELFRKELYGDVFNKLQEKAMIDSVIASNSIEGIGTSEERIQEIFKGSEAITHDEMEILGYKEALNYIHTKNDIEVDERTIKYLHYLIEKDVDPGNAGQYKSGNNYIMEYHSDGTRKIRFTPVDHKEVPNAVEQLLLAYYDARQDDRISQLLLSFCFVLDFTCIHPFKDGNGRVSRLLTLLLLYKAGYDIGKYVSIENQINDFKDQYYAALNKSSVGWHNNENDYSYFIIFMLQIMYRCYLSLNDSLGELTLKKAKKKDRIKSVVESSLVPISKMQIKDMLPDISVRTIEAQLKSLIDSGDIIKIGTYKDARYISKK